MRDGCSVGTCLFGQWQICYLPAAVGQALDKLPLPVAVWKNTIAMVVFKLAHVIKYPEKLLEPFIP